MSPAAARRRRSCRSSRWSRRSGAPSRSSAATSASLDRGARRDLRRDVQVVFQDPLASLDPRLPVGDIIAEPLKAFGVDAEKRGGRVRELLELVGLSAEHANRYPADFSGGQRQRIGIARALALEPRLLVLDEPVSALDVSIQAGVLNLLEDLKVRLGLSYLFVAHDLSVVRHVADRVAVMYVGRLVEVGAADDVFDRPTHPYTQALLSAVPIPDPVLERQRTRILVRGDLPEPGQPALGLPLPVPLPAVHGTAAGAAAALHRRGPGSGAARRRPRVGLPLGPGASGGP